MKISNLQSVYKMRSHCSAAVRGVLFACLTGTLLAGSLGTGTVLAGERKNHHGTRQWRIEGKATTGPNDVCGVPQWNLPAPFGPAHFTFLGAFDPTPGATDAVKLSATHCAPDLLLATTVDPNFQAFFGFPDPDPRLKNLPLRSVWTIAGFDGVRSPLPAFGSVPANPLPPTRSRRDKPITLGDWLHARGRLYLRCYADGHATVDAQFSRLVPDGLYGVYGIWKTTLPGASQPTFLPVALGGVPHVVTADARGAAEITRDLDYCPMDATVDGSVLMLIDLAYHADSITHGAFPFTPAGTVPYRTADGVSFQSTQPPGTVTHVHVGFPINAEPIDP